MPFDRRLVLLPLVDSAQLWVVLRSNRRERDMTFTPAQWLDYCDKRPPSPVPFRVKRLRSGLITATPSNAWRRVWRPEEGFQ